MNLFLTGNRPRRFFDWFSRFGSEGRPERNQERLRYDWQEKFWSQEKLLQRGLVFGMKLGFLVLLGSIACAIEPDTIFRRHYGKVDYHSREILGGPRVALALSGGGARGLAHIGALKAFEEKHIHISAIAGTSMGAVIGGLYAVGYAPDSIRAIVQSIDFQSLFSNSPTRRSLLLSQRESRHQSILTLRFDGTKPIIPSEFTSAQRVTEILTSLTMARSYASGNDFSRFPTPFAAVTTDVVSGKAVILESGDLAGAMRASMAFPLAISGVERGEMLLMDGGMLKPVPVDVARAMAVPGDQIVAINATRALLRKDSIRDPFNLASQVTTVMSLVALEAELANADFVITPSERNSTGAQFDKIDELIADGYRAALLVADSIVSRCQTESSIKKYSVDSVTVLGATNTNAPLVAGKTYSADDIDSLFANWVSAERFMSCEVTLSLRKLGGTLSRVTAVVSVTPSPALETRFLVNTIDFRCTADSLSLWTTVSQLEPGLNFIDSVAAIIRRHLASSAEDFLYLEELRYSAPLNAYLVTLNYGVVNERDLRELEETRPSYIVDRSNAQPGQRYTRKNMEGAFRDLFGSGLFRRVGLGLEPKPDGMARLAITLEEHNTTVARLGLHWHDEYNGEGMLEFADLNGWGVGMQTYVRLRAAERRKDLTIGTKMDRLFRTYLTYDLRAFVRRLDVRVYSANASDLEVRREDHLGGELRIGQHLARLGLASASVRLERIRENSIPDPSGQWYSLRVLELRSEVEDFDRDAFPRSGRRHLVSVEFCGRPLAGSVKYTKWLATAENYFPLSGRITGRTRFILGGADSRIPEAERWRYGGLGTFEGLKDGEMIGERVVLGTLESRWSPWRTIHVLGRWNGGAVYDHGQTIDQRRFRSSWALVAAYESAFGPLTLAFGHANGGREELYFSAGFEF